MAHLTNAHPTQQALSANGLSQDRDIPVALAAILLTIILVSGTCWLVCHCDMF